MKPAIVAISVLLFVASCAQTPPTPPPAPPPPTPAPVPAPPPPVAYVPPPKTTHVHHYYVHHCPSGKHWVSTHAQKVTEYRNGQAVRVTKSIRGHCVAN